MQPGLSRQIEWMYTACRSGRGARVTTYALGLAGSVLCASIAVLCADSLGAQGTAPPPPATAANHAKKSSAAHPNLAAAQPAVQPAPAVSVTPAALPPPPDWPANDHPSQATVTWDSHGLRVVAANSSLSQILKEISTQTGATLEGLGKDQRIFGVYGPGQARDVITQLLDGAGYNVLMIGDSGQGTPRQIILTPQSGGGAQAAGTNNQAPANDDDSEPEQEAQQPEPPPQQQPPMAPAGAAPAVPVRSQQQIIEQLQERQREIQQQQQQQAQPQNP
jgi:hypothetical protein